MKRKFAFCSLAVVFSSLALGQPASPPREGPPKLPAPVTSFGAAVSGDWLYVYGGHVGKPHAHSAENLHDGFHRINLVDRRSQWESLPMGTKLQGLAFVEYSGKPYRVGGLEMRNKSDESEDLHSTAEFSRFDPSTKTWESLPPLPEPRSSHDGAVLDGRLYVVGGWKLTGDSSTAEWAKRGYVADLRSDTVAWKPLPEQPFQNRALAVAATNKKIYAIGGMNHDNKPVHEVHVFDPESQLWSRGPDLPTATPMKAFAVSAFGVGDTVWASAVDGRVYSLRDGADAWHDTGYTLKTPRFFHRLLPQRDQQLLFIGGAGKEKHLDNIEAVEFTTLNAPTVGKLKTESPEAVVGTSQKGSQNWPAFRGRGDSRTEAKNLPVEWAEEKNIAWRAEIPGHGQSSPVVWNDKVFVTSVEGAMQEKLHVLCFDLTTGKQLWAKSFDASQPVASSDFVSKAAPTPAADADRLYVFFESGDLLALDHKGKTLWQRSLIKEYGPIKGNHGLGSSPALTRDSLVLLVDHDGPSYLLCVDKKSGENRWKVDREPRVSWSSPIVAGEAGREKIFVSSNGSVESFDATDGKRRWVVSGLKGNTVPSPSIQGNLVVIGSGERDSSQALNLDGTPLWRAEAVTSNFGSPLLHNTAAYFVNKAGVVSSVSLQTGAVNWTLRLPASCWASPLAAGDLLYFFSTDGRTTVIRDVSGQPVKVAENYLPTDTRVYGYAAVDGALILRTGNGLIRVGAK